MLATFFTISEENITTILGYAGDLVGDAMPLLIIFLGIGIGLIILKVFFNLFK